MLSLIKPVHLLIAFLIEIALVIIAGYWGFQQSKNPWLKYVLAALLPLLVIVLWGIFAAPKSQYRLELTYRLLFELVLFSAATYALQDTSHSRLAIGFAILVLLTFVGAIVFERRS